MCSEQFWEEIARFNMHLLDFVRKIPSLAILAVGCYHSCSISANQQIFMN